MARTVVAIYDDFQSANSAIRDLVDMGHPRDNISLIANDARGEYGTRREGTGEQVADETGAGAGVGAGIGAAIGGIGGLLIGLGALTIPGIGPVIAAGPLAVALSTLTGAGVGAVAGGVTGGLLGALIGLGIPEDEAEYYAEGVRRGGVLVTVQADEANTDQIMNVLNRHNPIDINERAAEWRSTGWTGFDPNAETMSSRDTMVDRDRRGSDFDMLEDDVEVDEEMGTIANTGAGYDTPSRAGMTSDVADSDYTTRRGTMGMNDYDTDFDVESPVYQNHYNTYLADSGYPYDYYVPAYRYGYGLASDARYQNRDWNAIESDVRHDWEREHPGTWDRFRMAIRHAWEDLTGQDRSY